jgi:tRNA threonylcarbamoyladenosine biosynthesis protein TsaE
MTTTLTTHSTDQTIAIGRLVGDNAQSGDVVLLQGDLGSGKTTLTSGIGEALGTSEVTSPTFILVGQHDTRITLYHVDLYRLGNVESIEDLGIEDTLGVSGLTVVEWPERCWGCWPIERLLIRFEASGDDRKLIFEPVGARYEALANQVAQGAGHAARD